MHSLRRMIVRRWVPCRASLQLTEGDDDDAWMAFMPYCWTSHSAIAGKCYMHEKSYQAPLRLWPQSAKLSRHAAATAIRQDVLTRENVLQSIGLRRAAKPRCLARLCFRRCWYRRSWSGIVIHRTTIGSPYLLVPAPPTGLPIPMAHCVFNTIHLLNTVFFVVQASMSHVQTTSA